jgi:hypothetical protein
VSWRRTQRESATENTETQRNELVQLCELAAGNV